MSPALLASRVSAVARLAAGAFTHSSDKRPASVRELSERLDDEGNARAGGSSLCMRPSVRLLRSHSWSYISSHSRSLAPLLLPTSSDPTPSASHVTCLPASHQPLLLLLLLSQLRRACCAERRPVFSLRNDSQSFRCVVGQSTVVLRLLMSVSRRHECRPPVCRLSFAKSRVTVSNEKLTSMRLLAPFDWFP